MEQVLSKPQAADRRFGLLACEHAFCLRCIRSWRRNRTADVDSAVRTLGGCVGGLAEAKGLHACMHAEAKGKSER